MIIFSRKERRGRKDFIPIPIYAGAGGVANFVTTRGRREFVHPLLLSQRG